MRLRFLGCLLEAPCEPGLLKGAVSSRLLVSLQNPLPSTDHTVTPTQFPACSAVLHSTKVRVLLPVFHRRHLPSHQWNGEQRRHLLPRV